MLKNISVAKKFAILIVLVFVGMTGLYSISTYTITKSSIGSSTYQSIASSKDLLADILPPPLYVIETYLDALQIISTSDAAGLEKLYNSVAQHKKDFEQQYNFWRASGIDPQIKLMVDQELYPTGRAVFEIIETKIKPAVQGNNRAAAEAAAVSQLTPAYQKHRDVVDKLATLLEAYSRKVTEEGRSVVETGRIFFTTIFIVGLALITLISLGIALGVIRPLRECMVFAKNITRGELDSQISLQRRDDFGALANSLSTMLTELKHKISLAEEKNQLAVQEVTRATHAMQAAQEAREKAEDNRNKIIQAVQSLEAVVNVVATASEELSSQVEQSSRGADEQSGRVRETATAMEEMNATVLEVSKNAQQAADASSNTKKQALEA